MTNDNAATKFLVQDLDLYYGKFQALKKINLDIKEKEITALIGPSGCGKSSFLKTLNRMNDLEEGVRIEGSIALDGKDIFAEIDPISLRHRVGMVFQQPNPFPKSIYDNVAYGPRIHGVTKKSELDKMSVTRMAMPDTDYTDGSQGNEGKPENPDISGGGEEEDPLG